MKAVVLAAGEGIRLQPITSTRPKHLIKVGGKPILEHCLDALKSSGITEVVIVTHYMSDSIRQHFGNGGNIGLKITYVEQSEILGTANAVSVVQPNVKGDFILVYGDVLFSQETITNLIQLYEKEKPAAAMAVVTVGKPESYGVVELENKNTIKSITEKPVAGKIKSNLVNAGLYVISEGIFEKIKEIKTSIRGECELTDALSLFINDGKRVAASIISKDDWIDIGRPWDLLEANSWVLNHMEHNVIGTVEDGAHLIGPVTVAETARIRSGAYIEGPCVIDERSDIGPNCYIRPCTSIGKNVRIGNACEIKNSIIMDWTHIGHLAYVGDSILCERCNLAAGTILANLRLDNKNVKMTVKNDIVDSGRRKLGSIMGDDVKTGINALFMPGVKIGTNSWIGSNFTVYRDVPANTISMHKKHEKSYQKSA